MRSILFARNEVYGLVEAQSGLEALHKASAMFPTLVIVSATLPHLDGFNVAKRVRKRQPETRVLVISAGCGPGIIRISKESGAHGFLCSANFESDLAGR